MSIFAVTWCTDGPIRRELERQTRRANSDRSRTDQVDDDLGFKLLAVFQSNSERTVDLSQSHTELIVEASTTRNRLTNRVC